MTRNPSASILFAAAFVVLSAPAAVLAEGNFTTQADQPEPFGTPAEEQGLIANICGVQLPGLGAAGCACLAEHAMTELDKPQRNYLILSVVQPQAAERTDTARSAADVTTIATFIRDAGAVCASAQPGAAPAPGTAPAQ